MTADRQDQLAAVTWRKSSFSGSQGDCVEIAGLPGGGAAVRDSKDPDGAVLTFTAGEWAAFLAGAKTGEFG
jgi:Domain of unknown function (DUF397)